MTIIGYNANMPKKRDNMWLDKTHVVVCDKTVTIDECDYEMVKKYHWYIGKVGYPCHMIGRKTIYMHRLILGFPETVVDHIDRNKLNNTRNNLRACGQGDNMHNASKRSSLSTSTYKGVSYDRFRGTFRARFHNKNKQIFLGRYNTAYEAALAYDAAVERILGNNFATNKNLGLL